MNIHFDSPSFSSLICLRTMVNLHISRNRTSIRSNKVANLPDLVDCPLEDVHKPCLPRPMLLLLQAAFPPICLKGIVKDKKITRTKSSVP